MRAGILDTLAEPDGRNAFWRRRALVTPLQVSQVDEALAVLSSALGAGYVSQEELATYIDATAKRALVGLDEHRNVVGVATSELLDASGLREYVPSDQQGALNVLLPELTFNRVGLVRSVAVSESARGNGVATEMVRASVEELWRLGATCILSVGWMDGAGCHIQGPLDSLGFSSRGDLANYWAADSLEKGYQCASCGRPCACIARIFILTRSGEK